MFSLIQRSQSTEFVKEALKSNNHVETNPAYSHIVNRPIFLQ
ncbi:MAG: hypothetical protein ACI8YQ_003089 [Polaribacter sp.]|jgi:hypothetical protein